MVKAIKNRLQPFQHSRTVHAPVMKLIGMRIIKISKGKAVLALSARKHHLNTIGSVHGGILCDLADAAMGAAFTTLAGKGRIGVTVEFKINFLRPVFAGEKIKALAKVISHGKSLYFTECELRAGRKGLVAKSSGLCKLLRSRIA